MWSLVQIYGEWLASWKNVFVEAFQLEFCKKNHKAFKLFLNLFQGIGFGVHSASYTGKVHR